MSVFGPKHPVFKWLAESCDLTIQKPDVRNVWFSDISGFRMVAVFAFRLC